jgi:osmotically inducible lipoprotein OsmB
MAVIWQLTHLKGNTMKTMQQIGLCAAALALAGLMGCSNMTRQEKGTAIGAGAGAIIGEGVLGTLGGAAIGGVIGHEITKPK